MNTKDGKEPLVLANRRRAVGQDDFYADVNEKLIDLKNVGYEREKPDEKRDYDGDLDYRESMTRVASYLIVSLTQRICERFEGDGINVVASNLVPAITRAGLEVFDGFKDRLENVVRNDKRL